MKRSQTAKTSKTKKRQHKPKTTEKAVDEIVSFINEEDRQTFCLGIASMIKDPKIKETIRKKQAKYKSFTVKAEIADFKNIGVNPLVVLHFKRVKNTDEWDLDITVSRRGDTNIEEYFDLVLTEKCK